MSVSVKGAKAADRREANYRKQGPLPADHPSVATGKVGVLLVNLGTPDGHDKKNMRKYLEEFLTDARVIEWPKLLWYPILYGIVLNTRPKKSGAAYERSGTRNSMNRRCVPSPGRKATSLPWHSAATTG